MRPMLFDQEKITEFDTPAKLGNIRSEMAAHEYAAHETVAGAMLIAGTVMGAFGTAVEAAHGSPLALAYEAFTIYGGREIWKKISESYRHRQQAETLRQSLGAASMYNPEEFLNQVRWSSR